MKKEEKIEVMFESILLEMEKISKSISNKNFEEKIEDSVIDESSTDQIYDQLESVNKRIDKLNVMADHLGPINANLHDIKWRIENAEHIPKGKRESFHYIWFFPDLKGWLSLIKRGTVAWLSIALLILSVGINYYLGKDYFYLKEQDSKYQYLKLSGDKIPLDELDSLWNIKSFRDSKLAFIDEAKSDTKTPQSNKK